MRGRSASLHPSRRPRPLHPIRASTSSSSGIGKPIG
jgi:hypothetical protein